jgi:sucrose-6-phosphate hydrolase SacC (GH32 family)
MTLDTSRADWAATHAALPVVEPVGPDRFALYLSLRDRDGRARIGRCTLTMAGRPRLEPLEAAPILDLGPLGAFDDSGVTSSSLVTWGADRFLYFTGWSRGVTVPFYLNASVAVSEDGGPFERLSIAPLLERSHVDPFLTASPFVLVGHGRWRMWYVSATEWRSDSAGLRHYYHIRYAESGDGITWNREGHVAVDYASDEEHAFARPWVVHDEDRYRMWFAVRGDRYRIAMAESDDGIVWTRRDTLGLVAGAEPWETDMVEYPCIFDWNGRRYMLYNGNDYGRTGVGLAVAE